jgi:hypothetical protein
MRMPNPPTHTVAHAAASAKSVRSTKVTRRADRRAIDLSVLVAAFRANTAAYFAGRDGDTSFGMELFHRAVVDRNEAAWQAIHDAYLPLVTGWITRHPSFPPSGEESAYLANRTFERFWRALRPERLGDFPTLPCLLRYLKLCAHGAVIDAARANRGADRQDLDGIDVASEGRGNVDRTEAVISAEQLWDVVVTVIRDPAQERLAWDTLVLGMTPREVVAARPDAWSSVGQVYEAKAALVRRLRRSAELAAAYAGDSSIA